MGSVGEMAVRRLSRYPHGSVWAPPREELKAGVGGAVYMVGESWSAEGPSRDAVGPKCSCR